MCSLVFAEKQRPSTRFSALRCCWPQSTGGIQFSNALVSPTAPGTHDLHNLQARGRAAEDLGSDDGCLRVPRRLRCLLPGWLLGCRPYEVIRWLRYWLPRRLPRWPTCRLPLWLPGRLPRWLPRRLPRWLPAWLPRWLPCRVPRWLACGLPLWPPGRLPRWLPNGPPRRLPRRLGSWGRGLWGPALPVFEPTVDSKRAAVY